MEQNTIAVYVTAQGKKMLEGRLDELVSRREEVAAKIREAREFGDLKENAEYAAAREAQSNLEDEIASIKDKMPFLKMFSYQKCDTSAVNMGTRVKVEEISTKKTLEWVITGVIENDPANNYISNESPLGKALFGRKVGEIVEIHKPTGNSKYKIVKISAGQ